VCRVKVASAEKYSRSQDGAVDQQVVVNADFVITRAIDVRQGAKVISEASLRCG